MPTTNNNGQAQLRHGMGKKNSRFLSLASLFLWCGSQGACLPTLAAEYSHPPSRPLPGVARAGETAGDSARFVDAKRGSDRNAGGEQDPWRTLGHAFEQLQPGDVLFLRGGRYFVRARLSVRGTPNQPVTIRGYPGELAVIDGGLREFYESPQTAWEPAPDGATGEYRSTRRYPHLAARADSTNLLGNFADSMVPLHGYRFLTDLRSDNHLFHKLDGSKTAAGDGLYCGPGLFLHSDTHRIHVRLAHTQQPSIGVENNYRGGTDPRKLSLVVAAAGPAPLELHRASYVVLRDLVVCGSRSASMHLSESECITLDGVTSYGGSAALQVEGTSGLRCVDCAFRGIAAPWLWRWSLKYRSIEARIVSASRWNPPARGNRDFEFARCEFTDCVDGVFIGNVDGVSIHHCLLDNVSDDGFFLTCRTAYDGTTPGGDFVFRQNRISRVLTAFAFGVGHGRQRTIDERGDKQLGKPTVIRHNVLDLREPVLYQQPVSGPIATFGRVCGDHGSPAWEPMEFEQNTVYMRESPWRNYYAAGLAKAMGKGTRRRIAKNLFVHQTGRPGEVFPAADVDFSATGNWHWSAEARAAATGSFLKRFRNSPRFNETGWSMGDRYGSPQQAPADVGAGKDAAVGVRGRLKLYGAANTRPMEGRPPLRLWSFPLRPLPRQPVALVLGYPAFDAPMLQFAFERAGADVKVFERQWAPAEQFSKYRCVAMLGSTVRAKMQPSGFSREEHAAVKRFLQRGGTLLVGRELMKQLFPGEGQKFVESLIGAPPRKPAKPMAVLQPSHRWLKHLTTSDWVQHRSAAPIRLGQGENLIGDPESSLSILADIPVGKGRLIYVGWDLSRWLPHGRQLSTLAQERAYGEQYQIYAQMVADVLRERDSNEKP